MPCFQMPIGDYQCPIRQPGCNVPITDELFGQSENRLVPIKRFGVLRWLFGYVLIPQIARNGVRCPMDVQTVQKDCRCYDGVSDADDTLVPNTQQGNSIDWLTVLFQDSHRRD